MKTLAKLWPLEGEQGLKAISPSDLVFDPTWSIRTWPRYCRDDHSEQVWWQLDQNCGLWSGHKVFLWFDLLILFLTQHDPYSNLIEILSRWLFWASLMKIRPKLWPPECSQGFSMIWPSDLVFDPTSPIFELDWDIVKMIILSKFDEDWTKNVISRVFTSQKLTQDTQRHDAHRQTETGNNSSPRAVYAQVS